jgi:hypothetical protein
MPFFDKITILYRRGNTVKLKQLHKKVANNGLLKLVINDSLLFPSTLYLLDLLKPLYRLPIDGNLFYPPSDIKKFITILSNEQSLDANSTFTDSGNIFVKIYSVTVRVLVLSRLIVLTSVYAYI